MTETDEYPIDKDDRKAIAGDEDNDNDEDRGLFADFELHGLTDSADGLSCSVHKCCDVQVIVGDVIRLKKVYLDDDPCIAGVLCTSGKETCTVGYVESPSDNWRAIYDQIDRHAVVIAKNNDVADCSFLNY